MPRGGKRKGAGGSIGNSNCAGNKGGASVGNTNSAENKGGPPLGNINSAGNKGGPPLGTQTLLKTKVVLLLETKTASRKLRTSTSA